MGSAEGAVRRAGLELLIGLILQAGQVGVFFGVGYLLSPAHVLAPLLVVLGSVGSLWLVLVYLLAYRPVHHGDGASAKGPTLVFAILSVLTGSVLPGLLYALAHHELGRQGLPTQPPVALQGPLPSRSGARSCPVCRRANPAPVVYCQGCGMILP